MKIQYIKIKSFFLNLKISFILLVINLTFTSELRASGTYTVGAGQTYSTLKLAFDAINAGSITGVIVLQISADCAETATASLNASSSGSASYTTINIYPTGSTRTISGALASSLVTLNGADNVTIDGRLSGSGTANSLIIENTSTSASAYTILFQLDATSNVVKYSTIKGAGTSTSTGTVTFLTAASGGNDSNTLDYNTITKSSTNLPYNQVYSAGTASITNSGISVTNNNIVDFSVSGINVNSESTTWTITGNSFYQSASITPLGTYYFIYINTGAGYTITGNYLGGQAASCGGNNFTLSTTAYQISGIYFGSSSSGGSTNTISSNTINNLSLTNTYGTAAEVNAAVALIRTGGSSNFTIGSSGNGNTLGITSGIASYTQGLTIACNGNPDVLIKTSLSIIQIASSGTSAIAYNTIGGITYTTSVGNNNDIVSMINVSAAGTTTINNNIIGNSTANNITVTSKSNGLIGIHQDKFAVTLTINNNTIQNFSTVDAASGSYVYLKGIHTHDGTMPLSIHDNTIKNFTLNNTTHSADFGFYYGSLMGMFLYGYGANDWNIYGNSISNFVHAYTGANLATVVGISVDFDNGLAGNVNVYKNIITTLSSASTSSSSGVVGLYLEYSGSSTISTYNNIIILSDGANTVSKTLRGIMDYSGGINNYTYHNTVKLYATYTSGTGNTAAFTYSGTGTHKVKNNIWQNLSTGGSGGHYAQRWISTYVTPANIRNNYNEVTANASQLCYWATDETLANWRTAISDASNTELNGSISISYTTGQATASTTIGSAGTPISAITTDYSGTSRSGTTPWIGAYEGVGTTYYSKNGLAPNLTSSWNSNRDGSSGSAPGNFTSGDIFIVQGTASGYGGAHSVTTSNTLSISGTSSKLWIEGGGTLTASHQITLNAATTFQIDALGTYIHNNTTTSTNTTTFAGTESFASTSTLEFQDFDGTSAAFGSVMAAITGSVGNIKWNIDASNNTAFVWQINSGPTITIGGDLTIARTGTSGSVKYVTSGSGTLTVSGNMYVQAGKFYQTYGTSGATIVLNITKDFTITSGALFDFAPTSNTTSTLTLNLGGNLTAPTGTFKSTIYSMNITFNGGSGVSPQYWNVVDAVNMQVVTINSTKALQLQSNLVTNCATGTCGLYVNGTLTFGSGSIDGTDSWYVDMQTSTNSGGAGHYHINVASTGVLKSTSPYGLSLSTTQGNIHVATTLTGSIAKYVYLDPGATYHYIGNAAQVTGNILPSTASGPMTGPLTGGLIINNSAGVTLTTSTTVSGTVTLTSGILTTSSSSYITITNTSSSAISNGSSTTFISGPLVWYLATSAGTGTYIFPVGKNSTFYPYTFSNYTGTVPQLTVEAFANFCGGTPPASKTLSGTEYWKVIFAGTSVTGGTVKLDRQIAIASMGLVGTSTTAAGAYSSLGGSVSGTSITATSTVGTVSASTAYYAMITSSCASYSGTINIGTAQTFANLTHATTSLATCGYTGNIVLSLQSDYVSTYETFPISFGSTLGSGSLKTITVTPGVASALSISGSNSGGAIVNIDAASYIQFWGGLSGSGTTSYLSITNTAAAAASNRAVLIQNNASNNYVKYCTVKADNSSTTATTAGVVFIGNGSSGNTSIVIDNNTITSNTALTGAACLLVSNNASASTANSGSITSNKFVDFTTNGIWLSTLSNLTTITGNSFYQSGSQTPATNVIAINVNNTGSGYNISTNYIGGKAVSCGADGSPFTLASAANTFTGIYLNAGTASTNSIQGNTIKNITLNSTTGGATIFSGISVAATGTINIGTSTANNIGNLASAANNTTNTSSGILVISTTTLGVIYGINCALTSGTATIQKNNIGCIGTSNVSAIGYVFYGIKTSGTGTIAIGDLSLVNTIGSTTIGSSILIGGASTAAGVCSFYGINNSATGAATINYNNIYNVTVYGTGISLLYPIYNTGTATSSISSNTIRTLSNASAGAAGINTMIYSATAATISISSNTISSITINNGYFRGIYDNVDATGYTHTIYLNTIGSNSADNILITSTTNSDWSTPDLEEHAGIYIGSKGTYNISTNTIQNITQSGSVISILGGILVCGISVGDLVKFTIDKNVIDYLSSTAAYATRIFGIGFRTSYRSDNGSSVSKNTFKNFKNLSTLDGNQIIGIYDYTASGSNSLNISNNFFECNNEESTNKTAIWGLNCNTSTWNVYYNTIKIWGSTTDNTASVSNSVCIQSSGTLTAKNNIFFNSRSCGGTTSKQYVYYSSVVQTGINYNYYYNATDATFAYSPSADRSSSTFNGSGNYQGGTNSVYAITSPITISDGGSLSAADLVTVVTGADLSNSTTYPGCQDDINAVVGNRATASTDVHKGCFEAAYATYYWVGGDGNWSDYTNHWSTSSGGAPNCTAAPTGGCNVIFNGSSSGGTCVIDGTASCYNITTTGYAGTISIGANILNITNAATLPTAVTVSTGTLTVNGTYNGTSGSLTFSGAGNLNLNGATVTSLGTFTPSTSVVTYGYAGAQIVLAATYNDLVIGGGSSSTKTLGGAIILNSDLTINASTTLDAGSGLNYAINVASNWTNNGTFTCRTGTVTLDGTATTHAITGTNTFYHLTIGGTSSVTATTTITIGGTFTVNSGTTFTPSAGTVTMNAVTSSISNSGTLTFYGLTISETPTAQTQYNASYSIAGTLTVSASKTFAPSGGTITMSAATSALFFTGATAITFYNLTIAATPTSQTTNYCTNASAFSVSNTFTLNNGITFTPAGSVTITMSGASGSIVNNATTTTLKFFNLTISGTVSSSGSANGFGIINTGTMSVTGTFTPAAADVITYTTAGTLSGTGTVKVTKVSGTNDFFLQYVFGTRTLTSLTVVYSGSGGAQGVSTSTTYYNVTLNNSAGASLAAACTISNNLTLTSGILTTTSTNLLTVTNTSTAAITGGSTSYIDGPVKWSLSTTAGDIYAIPVGKGGKYLNMTYTGNTVASQSLQVEAFSSFCGGSITTPASSYLSGEYWSITYAATTTVGTVKFCRPYSLGSYDIIGTCATLGGVYQSLGGSISSNTITATSAINTHFTVLAASTKYYTMVASGGCSSYSGTITVGPTSTFNSLTHGFSSLNTCGYTGNIILALQSDYNGTSVYETFPITIPATFATIASSNTRIITVQPAAGVASTLSITGSAIASSANVVLNGADWIVFDGRPISGSTNYLTISNSSTTNGAAVKFVDDATNNTFKYCTITSTYTSTTNGAIWFSTSSVTSGNDNNTIDRCVIDGAAGASASPTSGVAEYGIYSLGTTGKENGPNSVTNCEFKDVFVSGASSGGILLSTNNDNWNITTNSFYQTNTRTAAGVSTLYGIKIVDGDQYTITGNYFGGNAASCSGTWTQGQSSSNYNIFYGIDIAAASAGTVSSIQNNTFKGFNWSLYGSASEIWTAIRTTAGNFNIGTTTANTIGASSGTGAITFSHANIAGAPVITCIDVATANTATIRYNIIGSMTLGNASNQYYTFAGIKTSGAGTLDVQYNQIANTDVASSIEIQGTSASGSFTGISNIGTGVVNIKYNTLGSINSGMGVFYGVNDNAAAGANAHRISNNTIGTSSSGTSSIYLTYTDFYGINIGSTGSAYNIDSNTIRNITSTYAGSNSMYGIYAASTGTYNMNGNSISNLVQSTSNSGGGVIAGIYFAGINTSSTIQKNRMTGFSSLLTAPPSIYGIYNGSTGTVLLYNNLFVCNNGGNTNNCQIFGIYSAAAAIITMYHNTISITGTNGSATTDPHSSCVNLTSATANQVQACKNNIFNNQRVAGNTEKHYCFRMGGLSVDKTAGDIDYNYYSAKVDASFAAPGGTGITSTTFNSGVKGYGGVNSKYFSPGAGNNSSVITVNTDGSLSAAHLTIVGTGADLHTTPGIVNDINGTEGGRAAGAGYKGCYEGASGYYWVGNGGNWSDATHWATSSGGTTFNSAAPTATNNVVFDASSGTGNVVINSASTCANFTGTGYTGAITGTSGLTISGNLVVGSSMSWTHTGSTTFNSTATGKTITSNGVSLATPITFDGTGGAWTLADALTTTGAVTLTAGTLSLSSYTMSTGGNFSIASTSTFTPSTGTVNFTGSDAAINGTTAAPSFYNIVVNKTAGQTLSTSGSVTSLAVTNNFTETQGHFTAPATMSVTGATTLTAGTFTAPSGVLTLSGALTDNGGTFTHNSGTTTFTGNSSAINGTDAAETFYAMIVNKTAGQTLSTGGSVVTITVDNNFTETQGDFTAPATMTITGTSTLTAGTFTAPSGTLNLNSTFTDNGGTFTNNSGTTNFTGSSSAITGTDVAETFNNVTINKTAGQTLSTSGSMVTITVAGTFTETTGHFTAPATMTITGNATLSAGTFTAPSGTLTLSANLVNNTTFTHNSGTVSFNGGSAQTISGSVDPSFYNLTINNSSTGITLGLSTSCTNTLTLIAGLLKTVSYTLTLGSSSANATVSGGSSSAYIVAYDNSGTIGYLKHFVNLKASTAYVYPIGDLTRYTPFTFTVNNTSTLAAGAYFTLYTKAATISGLSSNVTTYLTRFWRGTDSGITTPNYDISYSYSATDAITGTEANLRPIKKSGSNWYKPTGSTFTTGTAVGTGGFTIGTRTLTWAGLTSFSDYGGVGPAAVALPIETVEFKGQKTTIGNKLEWKTESEHQSDYFTIEKTTDGQTFEIVGKVDGAGSSNKVVDYELIDANFINGINYYRLVRTNYDGLIFKTDLISIDNRIVEGKTKTVAFETNILGQEINEYYRGLVIIVYTDGSTMKVIR